VLRVDLFAAEAASAAPGKIERGNCVVQSPQAAGLVIIKGGVVLYAQSRCGHESSAPRLHFWQAFAPVIRIFRRNDRSTADLARDEATGSDFAAHGRQSDVIEARKVIERIGLLQKNGLHGGRTLSQACAAFRRRWPVSDRVVRDCCAAARTAYRRLTKAVPSALLTAVAKRTGD
jgi:hypothetical protein